MYILDVKQVSISKHITTNIYHHRLNIYTNNTIFPHIPRHEKELEQTNLKYNYLIENELETT